MQRTEGNFDILDQDLNLDPGKFFLTYPSRKPKQFLTKIVETTGEFCYPRSVVEILHIIPWSPLDFLQWGNVSAWSASHATWIETALFHPLYSYQVIPQSRFKKKHLQMTHHNWKKTPPTPIPLTGRLLLISNQSWASESKKRTSEAMKCFNASLLQFSLPALSASWPRY